jgi:hypothetical protein
MNKKVSSSSFLPFIDLLFVFFFGCRYDFYTHSFLALYHPPTRVTRFLACVFGGIVFFGQFLLITAGIRIFGLLFQKSYVLMFTKNWLGYILGDFFTKASGHPAPNTHTHSHGEMLNQTHRWQLYQKSL